MTVRSYLSRLELSYSSIDIRVTVRIDYIAAKLFNYMHKLAPDRVHAAVRAF